MSEQEKIIVCPLCGHEMPESKVVMVYWTEQELDIHGEYVKIPVEGCKCPACKKTFCEYSFLDFYAKDYKGV